MDSCSDDDSLIDVDAIDVDRVTEVNDEEKARVTGNAHRMSDVEEEGRAGEGHKAKSVKEEGSLRDKPEEVKDDACFQPVFEKAVKGLSAERLLKIIVGEDVAKDKLCKRVPRGIRYHAVFVVDTKSLGSSDIISYGDDNGGWTGHSNPRRNYQFEICDESGIALIQEYSKSDSTDPQKLPSNVYTLCRNYFRHAHTPEFRKVIATVRDWKGNVRPLAVVQYYFEGVLEVPVKLARHGNAKKENASPYMRTSRPVLTKLKEKCSQETCRKAVDECFMEAGGSSGITVVADVPRDRKQAYNLKKKIAKENHRSKTPQRHEFYDVLELLNKGTFMRDFAFQRSTSKASRTQPRSFQATDFQLNQLTRICESEKYASVLGVDATFNCGNFFVTLTSFQHKMFVNKQSGKHPVILGPSVIHMTKEFEDYHYLAGRLKVHCKNFGSLKAFGTDGEINLANAFVCERPDAIHLRCKIHLCDNIERKLTNLSFNKDARQNILETIFGRRQGNARVKALADATSSEEFDEMMEA